VRKYERWQEVRAHEFAEDLDEGWKDTLANLGIAGAIAAGGTGSAYLQGKFDEPAIDKDKTAIVKQIDAPKKKDFTLTKQDVKKDTKQEEKAYEPFTNSKYEKVLAQAAQDAGIKGVELAAFMSQMAHESEYFKDMVEDRPNVKKYLKTKSLGNKNLNDAKRFIGRGFIQLTGRWNYKWMEKELGIDLTSTWSDAHKAADPEIAAKIAVTFWKKRVRPNVKDFSDVKQVTKPINSNLNGLKSRASVFNKLSQKMNIKGTGEA
jgi:predicted chitinase